MFESKHMSQEAVICGPHGRLRCGSHRQTAPAVNILPNSLCSWWCSVGRGNSRVPHCSLIGPHGVWFCQQDMGVVAFRSLGICTHWGTQEVSHNVTILIGGHVSFPMHLIFSVEHRDSGCTVNMWITLLLVVTYFVVAQCHCMMSHTHQARGYALKHACGYHVIQT